MSQSRTKANGAAPGDAPLLPSAAGADRSSSSSSQPPTAAIAALLIAPTLEAGRSSILYMASSEQRGDEIGRALRQLAPNIEVLVLPPWDCLPYDRASPSPVSMGRRMAVLARLTEPADGPRAIISSPEALLQRIPPQDAFRGTSLTIEEGMSFDREALEVFARTTGYVVDDRIDEPGEIAVLGEVVDVFPAAAGAPVRIVIEAGHIAEIKVFDPLTQRSGDRVSWVVLGPASELILKDPPVGEVAVSRRPGIEHGAPDFYQEMPAVFEWLPGVAFGVDPSALQRAERFHDQVQDAYDAQNSLGGSNRALPPERLYISPTELANLTSSLRPVVLAADQVEAVPRFALEKQPAAALASFVQDLRDAGLRVAVSGLAHELKAVRRSLKRVMDLPSPASSWADLTTSEPGTLLVIEADLESGYIDRALKTALICASDLLGGRVAKQDAHGASRLLEEPDLKAGDLVVHEDHGIGILRGLEQVEVNGARRDAVRLEYHGGDSLLVPVEELGRIWRYGSNADAVALDRLHTDAWSNRRIRLSAEIDRSAEHLVALASERDTTRAAILEPPRAAYDRFAARFPHPPTADQAEAIEAVLSDLRSGRPMNRLICGDVGFGKTEVALRAAAAAALSGKQVAVIAPTTVLARQHFQTFSRRFAGTDIKVGHLSRLVSKAEAAALKTDLAAGTLQVVVGTHAIAAKGVRFADLALIVIDEEQRLGAKLKQSLQALGRGVHRLTMTATPIPRTLQMAMIGVEDVSVIATPPARRRPIRTFLAPFDAATVRTALLREKRRGGQSFVVVPRIEDISLLEKILSEAAPELSVRVAHGKLPPEEVDEVMVGFADGQGDVLLATNIIESGLDVPNANTMLVWRADRFGLAQLHQLRGRVGRGRRQGTAYLMTAPDIEVPETTRKRLSTLEAFDRLGSGLAISAHDLDFRGAGDLIGEDQAGHVREIGTSLYQRLLTRALRVARGEIDGPEWRPEINIEAVGSLDADYVPDPMARLNLLARLARMASITEIDDFAEELEDRFGGIPDDVRRLLETARLTAAARDAGITRIDAGPKALALSFQSGRVPSGLSGFPDASIKGGRLICARKGVADDAELLFAIFRSLDRSSPPSLLSNSIAAVAPSSAGIL